MYRVIVLVIFTALLAPALALGQGAAPASDAIAKIRDEGMTRSEAMKTIRFLTDVIGPRLTNLRGFRLPLWIGFAGFLISQLLLAVMPPQTVIPLVVSVVLEGAASALVSPMTESLLAVSLESDERARVSAMVYVILMVLISPFGWIAGQLSALDRALPFALNTGLFVLGILFVWVIGRAELLSFTGPAAESPQALTTTDLQ